MCSLPANHCCIWMVSQTIPPACLGSCLAERPTLKSTFCGDIYHIVKGYSSAVHLSHVISALKAKIIWRDFVHLLSCVKCVKNTCLQNGGKGGCFWGCEPTLGLDVPWALVGAPTGCGIQQDALETRLESKAESCRV